MSRLPALFLRAQSVATGAVGASVLLFPKIVAGPGKLLSAAPSVALHMIGLSALIQGSVQLVLSWMAPRQLQRNVLYTMAPTKFLAAFLFWRDGLGAVAALEVLSGLLFCMI